MSESVSLTKAGEIAVITIDNPPVNALSAEVAEGIRAALEAAQNDLSVKAIVLMGAGRTFIAGADIKEFGKITSGKKRDDIGLQKAIGVHYLDGTRPTVEAMRQLGSGWKPYRSVATWYLWRSLDPLPVEY